MADPTPTPAKQATFSTADLQAFFTARLQDALSTEQQLGAEAQAQLQAVSAKLTPLLQAEMAEMLASTNPTVQKQYLTGLAAVIETETAALALDAIAANQALVTRSIQAALITAVTAAVGILKIAALA